MQIMLDLDPPLLREVILALESRAAYLRGYKSDGMTAKQLEDVAAQIGQPGKKLDPVIKKSVARETSSAKKQRSA